MGGQPCGWPPVLVERNRLSMQTGVGSRLAFSAPRAPGTVHPRLKGPSGGPTLWGLCFWGPHGQSGSWLYRSPSQGELPGTLKPPPWPLPSLEALPTTRLLPTGPEP